MPPQEQVVSPDTGTSWDNDDSQAGRQRSSFSKNESTINVSNANLDSMENLDPFEPIQRRSIFHRESFLMQFASKKGPRAIFLLLMCLALGVGSTIGVVPAVMTDRYARLQHGYDDPTDCADYDMNSKPQECLDGSADAQNIHAIGNLISNILTFTTSSLMGSLSDEYGRRSLLVVGVFFSCLPPLCLVLIQFIPTMNPTWYYVVSASTGLVNWIALCMSALADVMPPEWRAASFGLLLAGLSLGFAGAPTLAILMGHRQVSIMGFFMVFLGWLNTLFFFPETLSPEKAAMASAVRRLQVEGMTKKERIIWNLKRPAWELSILNRNDFFRLLAVLAFFSGMVSSGDQTLLVYYLEERLAFKDSDVATMFMINGLLGVFAQAAILKPSIDCIGERMVLACCFVLGAIDNFMYGIARDKSVIFAAGAIGALSMVSFPTISAIKANNVNESEQGRIQGALYSVQALASGTGPMLMRFVYHLTVDGAFLGPGSMFVFASGLLMIASGCAYALPKSKADSRASRRRSQLPNIFEDFPEAEDESTPFVDPTARDSSSSSGSYGTEMP
ncbi:Hippocampus abundant transcript-like protein 1 [Seminavis robusta]|uniref:Hippocampus abundant transcript-like protein 1 n=1 Tax=Seminavis robusta TaxID=568900 RepID=A0A9N8E2A4_9STRA|nr:Hippocampus abundant transcript-like protein 1 [Seminavis robusta]|eukprot:Sro434_g142170.1 Hippocampus abundant transcript-like protein 1 (561) ;mRNA; f:62506-64428